MLDLEKIRVVLDLDNNPKDKDDMSTSLPNDEDGALSVVDTVVADAPQEGPVFSSPLK